MRKKNSFGRKKKKKKKKKTYSSNLRIKIFWENDSGIWYINPYISVPKLFHSKYILGKIKGITPKINDNNNNNNDNNNNNNNLRKKKGGGER